MLLSGFVYQTYYRPENIGGFASSERVVQIQMRVLKNQWKWQVDSIKILNKDGGLTSPPPAVPQAQEAAVVKVEPGDKVKISIYNEDNYDHGFAIDVFGVNKRLFPKSTTEVEFTASLVGKFNFYCSVPCGQGHYDQVGTIIVGDNQKELSSPQALAFQCENKNQNERQ